MTSIVASISTGTNGHRFSGKEARVLVAAISRSGWGSRAEFLARYRYRALPEGRPDWSGEVTFIDEPKLGDNVRLGTPFGVLQPIYPLHSRVVGMPRVKQK